MKRKRGTAKRKPKKPSALGVGEAIPNQSGLETDIRVEDLLYEDTGMDAETPQIETTMNGPVVERLVADEIMEDNVNSLPKTNMGLLGNLSKFASGLATKLSRNTGSCANFVSRAETETPVDGANISGWQGNIGKEGAVDGEMEFCPNSLRQMIMSVITEFSKEAGGIQPNISRGLAEDPIINTAQPGRQGDRTNQETSSLLHRDRQYKSNIKRKCGTAKCTPKRLSSLRVEKEIPNFYGLDSDFCVEDLLYEDTAMDAETPQTETNVNGPAAERVVANEIMEDNVNSLHKTNVGPLGKLSKFGGGMATKLSRDNGSCANFDSRVEIESPIDDTNMSGSQGNLEKEGVVNGMEFCPNTLRQMIVSVISEFSKDAGGIPTKVSSGLDMNPIINTSQSRPQGDRTNQEPSSLIHLDPRYKEQELHAALSVIKRIMKLDAAEPFSVPVDPIALGIPDYFDVIDTPMDFGTICYNLENGLKYLNSEHVFKDVQYIWENCCKYNKKGDYILELMNRVKTNFMKHWAAAGLYREQLQAIGDSTMTGKRRQEFPVCVVNDKTGPKQAHIHQPSLIQSQAETLRQADVSASSTGCSHLPPPMESTITRSKRGRECPAVPVNDNLPQQQNWADDGGSNHDHYHQLSSIDSQAGQPLLSSNQTHPSPQCGDAIIDSTSIQKKAKGRGPTRCLELLTTVGRIPVATNELGQPVGLPTSKLSSYLGLIARDGNLAPLTYPQWSKMPQENKEKLWQKVQSKFDIHPISKGWVLMSIGTKWRNFKSLLKTQHYDTHATDAERLADRDERVLPDQWSILVSQWNSEKWQEMSAKNKANRAKMKFCHTSGKKSFARVLEEERAKRPDGKEPSRAELFILTRTRKDGQPINEATAAVISQLRECTTQQQEILQPSIKPEEDLFSQVMGEKNDSKRLYKLGPCPSDLGAKTPTRAIALRTVSAANVEVDMMKEKIVLMEQTCAQMATQMATMMSMMTSMQKNSLEKPVPDTSNASESLRQLPAPPRQTRGRKNR